MVVSSSVETNLNEMICYKLYSINGHYYFVVHSNWISSVRGFKRHRGKIIQVEYLNSQDGKKRNVLFWV